MGNVQPLPIIICYDKLVCLTLLKMFTLAGNTEGGSITELLTSYLTGLDLSVLQIKTKIVHCHTSDSKPIKQEVNGTVILPPYVFPAPSLTHESTN